MNYLAHSFLSHNEPGLIVGNFIADHIHGNQYEKYPPGIIDGILMHRRIDTFTDAHQKFKESKRFFYNGYEKYSGILIDIYFDHLLAKNFHTYSSVSLKDYSAHIYSVYLSYSEILPKSSARFLNYVLKNNIYLAYSTIEGIDRVLFHLSHRINHGILLNKSVELFQKHESQLETNFELFFNDALKEFNN
ncbi:MAG: acyl carrier protein phosphodiesterase [Bacteroidia bacterium]